MKKNTSLLAIVLVCIIATLSLVACSAGIVSIELEKGSLEGSVLQNGTFDTSTAVVLLNYSDGTQVSVTAESLTFSEIDTSVSGTIQLTITYGDFSIVHNITVTEVILPGETVASIALTEGTVASKIEVDGTLDLSGAEVTATMDDGTTKIVPNSDLTFSTIETSVAGTVTLLISYDNVVCRHTVEVVDSAEGLYDVATLEVKSGTLSNSVSYQGTLDTSALVLVATYGNGIIEYVSEGYTMSTLDSTVLGETAVTFTYDGVTVDHTVTVSADSDQLAKIATNIELTTSPATKINRLATLDLSGVIASVTFMNGIATSYTYSDLSFSDIDNTVVGAQTLTISFTDSYGNVVSTTHTVTVNALSSETASSLSIASSGTLATKVAVGGTLDLSDTSFTVEFADGSTTTATGVAVSLDTTATGSATAVLSYTDIYGNKVTLDWAVTVVADDSDFDVVASIAVSGLSNTADYLETYSTASLVVVATYGDGTFATVTGATVSELDTTKLGSQDITVSYSGVSATYSVTVSATTDQQSKLVYSMTLVEGSVATSVVQNGTLNTDNLQVKIVYLNTKVETVGIDSLSLGDISTTTVGETQTLTVSYTDVYGNTTQITHSVSITEQPEDEVASELTVTAGSLANKVLQDGSLDDTNALFTVKFEDGHSEVVDASTVSIELDTTELGETTAVLSYTDIFGNTITSNWAVEVVADDSDFDVVASIAISGLSNSADYLEIYSTTSLVVVATYGDGTTAVVAGATVSELDTTKLGSQDITVSYGGATATYSVTVSLTSTQSAQYAKTIVLTTNPSSWVYRTSTLDTSAIVATVIFMDESKQEGITASSLTIGSIDTSTLGDKTLTISYTDTFGNVVSTTATVEVRAMLSETPDELTVIAGTLATSVNQNGTLSLTGASFTIEFADGSTATPTADQLSVTLSTATTGSATATITFTNDYGTATLSWAVTVVDASTDLTDVDKLSVKSGTLATSISYNGTLDTSNLVLSVTYKSGIVAEVAMSSAVTVVVNDNKAYTTGTTATITYDGASCEHALSVNTTGYSSTIAVSLSVTGLASKVAVGGSMDTSSMVVTVTYLSGTTSTLASSSYTMGNVSTSTAAEGKTVTISHTDIYGNVVTYTHTYDVVEASTLVVVSTLVSELLKEYNTSLSDSSETAFTITEGAELYAGDDNLYHFSAYATSVDSNTGDTTYFYDLSKISITITVELLSGKTYTEITGSDLANYMTVDYTYGTFLFDSSAIGSTFRITVEATNKVSETSTDAQFTAEVTVVDGYNIYTVDELSLYDTKDGYGTYSGIWSEYQAETYIVDTYKGTYTDGVVTYATSTILLSDIAAPDNFVLQTDLSITADSLPDTFFWCDDDTYCSYDTTDSRTTNERFGVSYESAKSLTSEELLGSLRDEGLSGIYHREFTDDQTTVFYGNYFGIDASAMPIAVVKNGESEGMITTTDEEDYLSLNGSALFYNEFTDACSQLYEYNTSVTWENISFNGNGQNSGKAEQSGSVMLVRTDSVNFTVDNCVITRFRYGLYFSKIAATHNTDTSNDSQVLNTKIYNCFMTHLYVQGTDLLVYNCDLEDASGPSILGYARALNDGDSANANITVVDSTISSIVNATSAWFAMYGAGDIVLLIAPHQEALYGTNGAYTYSLYGGTTADTSLLYSGGDTTGGDSQYINMICCLLPEGMAIGTGQAYGTYSTYATWADYLAGNGAVLDYTSGLGTNSYSYQAWKTGLDYLVDINTGGYINADGSVYGAHSGTNYSDIIYLYSHAALGVVLGLDS